MREIFFSIRAFLTYWLDKEDRYSQQSPFVFEFYGELMRFLKENKVGDPEIETFRDTLLKDTTPIKVLDLGAGSKKVPHNYRPISQITRYSTSGPKFALLYQHLCSLTPAETVVELGTCLGLSTRYLAKKTKGKLYTFEGSAEIQKVAQRAPLPPRTEFILGPIEEKLQIIVDTIPYIDFALIDANHTYEGTIGAFRSLAPKLRETSILAVGDIHWSPGMEKAWSEIKSHPDVNLTIDFFECGVLFFYYSGEKKHLVLHL